MLVKILAVGDVCGQPGLDALDKKLNIFDNSQPTIIVKEFDVNKILNKLYHNNIQSVIVEGGAKTHNLFLESGLWDEIRIFLSPKMLYNGTKAAKPDGTLVENIKISDNNLLIFRNFQ